MQKPSDRDKLEFLESVVRTLPAGRPAPNYHAITKMLLWGVPFLVACLTANVGSAVFGEGAGVGFVMITASFGSWWFIRKTILKRLSPHDPQHPWFKHMLLLISADEHWQVLKQKYLQGVHTDEYGKMRPERWMKDAADFVGRIAKTALDQGEAVLVLSAYLQSTAVVTNTGAPAPASAPMTGDDYEHACAEQLRRAGWEAHVSAKGADQGLDIAAMKGHLQVLIQCKFYTNAVGNKAVQEVLAARAFYAHAYPNARLVVVASNGFTRSAEDLALRSGVVLISEALIGQLEAILTAGGPSPIPQTN